MRSAVSISVLLLIAAVGCGKATTTPTTANPEPTPTTPATSSPPTSPQTSTAPTKTESVPTTTAPAKDPVVANITAFQLKAESDKDGNWLITKYAGQVVEMTGFVKDVRINYGNDPVLFLKATNDKSIVNYVICPLKQGVNPHAKVLPGQTVVLRGTILKSVSDPKPFYWEVISATGDGPPVRTFESLLNEYKSAVDVSAVDAKNMYVQLIVTGEIVDVEFDETRNKNVAKITIGKKGEPFTISCSFIPAGDSAVVRELRKSICKAGVKVRVIGEYSGATKTSCSIGDCIIIDHVK